jgi:hypothetical protein
MWRFLMCCLESIGLRFLSDALQRVGMFVLVDFFIVYLFFLFYHIFNPKHAHISISFVHQYPYWLVVISSSLYPSDSAMIFCAIL